MDTRMTFSVATISNSSWQRIAPLVIVILGTLLYAITLDVPFTFDDQGYIVDNPTVKDFRYYTDSSLAERAITQDKLNPNFRTRKLAFFTFTLNYKLHGMDVRGFHAVNILIHLACGLLVYALVLATLRTPFFRENDEEFPPGHAYMAALLAALFFIAHPVQTQAVTYTCQRFTSMGTMLYLLALVMYVSWRFRDADQGVQVRWLLYGLALLAALAAMFTKEIAFTLPLMIVLYEWMFFGRPGRKTIPALLPFLATMLILPAIIFDRITRLPDADVLFTSLAQPVEDNAALTYLFTQFRVIVTYLRLLFLPINQNLDYDFPRAASLLQAPVFASLLLLCLLAGLGVLLLVRSGRLPRGQGRWLRLISFGIFWFFLTLAVESTIIPLGDLIFEHRLYLPSTGFLLALLGLLEVIRPSLPIRNRIVIPVLLAVVLVVFSGATIRRNNLWRDPVAMGEDIVRKSPGKPRAHHYLAVSYNDAKRFAEAIQEYETALRHKPNPDEAMFAYNGLEHIYLRQKNKEKLRQTYAAMRIMLLQTLRQTEKPDPDLLGKLGYANMKLNRSEEAESALRQAIELKGGNATLHLHMGGLYIEQNRLEEGLANLREAVRLDPEDPLCLEGLGDGLAAMGKTEEALAAFQQADSLDPESVDIKLKLAEQHARLGNGEEAEKILLAAVAAGKDEPKIHSALGQFYNQQNRLTQAEQAYQKALQLEPDNAVLHMNLGAISLRQGRINQALSSLNRASELDPSLPDTHYNLGSAYDTLGDYTRAALAYQKVLEITPADAQAKQELEKVKQKIREGGGKGEKTTATPSPDRIPASDGVKKMTDQPEPRRQNPAGR